MAAVSVAVHLAVAQEEEASQEAVVSLVEAASAVALSEAGPDLQAVVSVQDLIIHLHHHTDLLIITIITTITAVGGTDLTTAVTVMAAVVLEVRL